MKTSQCVLSVALAIATGAANAEVIVTSDFTGIWDQPDQESQGVLIQIVEQPDGSKDGVFYWFTYDETGEPTWVSGIGPVNGNTVELDFIKVSGPTFLQPSDPSTRNTESLGSGTATFDSCGEGVMQVPPVLNNAVTGTGLIVINRLTAVLGSECSGGIADDVPAAAPVVEVGIPLINTGVDSDAAGAGLFEIRPGYANFEINIEDLDVGAYELFIAESLVGTIDAVDNGAKVKGKIEFSSPRDPGETLLTFDPRGKLIEVVAGGSVYLTSDANTNPPPSDPGNVEVVEIEVDLGNTGIYPAGSGEAEYEARSGRSEFKVEIEDVPVGSYDLVVAGASVGAIEVILIDGDQEGEIEFRNPAEPGKVLLDFDPRGQSVEVREGTRAIFSVNFPSQASVSDGGSDDDDDDDDEENFEIEVDLTNTGVDPDASGEARYRNRSGRRELSVEIKDLDDGSYQLVVGGSARATIAVDGGDGEIEFTDPLEDGTQALNFDPRGQTMTIVRDGETYLTADFPD